MSELMTVLSQALSGGTVSRLANQIGAKEDQTATAIQAALPILLGALNKNTNQAGGADALFGALSRDHDGGILDDIGSFLGGSAQQSAGEAILGHVLGRKREPVQTGLGRASGLDAASIAKLMALLAPIVMAAMGRVSRQKGLDANGVSGYLSDERKRAAETSPREMSVLENLLDANDDGQVIDDVMKLGTGLLGNFLNR